MKKYVFSIAVLALFAIGFAASDEEKESSTPTQTESATIKEEPQKPKNPKCRTCGKEFNPEEEYSSECQQTIINSNYCYMDCPQKCGTCGKTYTVNSQSQYNLVPCGTCGSCYYKHRKGEPGY